MSESDGLALLALVMSFISLGASIGVFLYLWNNADKY